MNTADSPVTPDPALRQGVPHPVEDHAAPGGAAGLPPDDPDVSAAPSRPRGSPSSSAEVGISRSGEWDVVVVGGGIGGLAAAGLLARAGRRVLVIETSAQLGGACLGVTAEGFRYDLGVGVITGAEPRGAVSILCDRLGIHLPVIPCDPTVQVALPRHRVSLPRAVDGWWPEIHREFPDDEESWHTLLAELSALAGDRDQLAAALPPFRPEGWRARLRYWRTLAARRLSARTRQATRRVLRAADTPFRTTLEQGGLGGASRRVLEACLWFLLLRGSDECSTLEAALAVQRLREGIVVVPPGPIALVEALARRIEECGGEIRLGTEAARCVAERGRIVGVTTKTGETIQARWTVTDVPPGILTKSLMPPPRGWFQGKPVVQEPWRPRRVAQVMGVTLPEAFLPSELGHLCLVIQDAGRPACDENLVFVRAMADDSGPSPHGALSRLAVGRFVSPSAATEGAAIQSALLDALDRILPGAGEASVHRALLSSTALGELWGRPMAAVRYAFESSDWLGRRGLAHQVGWPGLLAVGEWTHPGRLVSDVVEGAMHVADLIIASEGAGAPA